MLHLIFNILLQQYNTRFKSNISRVYNSVCYCIALNSLMRSTIHYTLCAMHITVLKKKVSASCGNYYSIILHALPLAQKKKTEGCFFCARSCVTAEHITFIYKDSALRMYIIKIKLYIKRGRLAEWFIALVLKTSFLKNRWFESNIARNINCAVVLP